MKTKKEATEAAAKLAEELGPGWKPEVWENLGWHHKAVIRDWSVRTL